MRIWPKKLTDAEYLENIRKTLQLNTWLRFLYVAVAIGFALMAAKFIEIMIDMLLNFAPAGQANNVLAVFAGAAGCGLVAGVFLTQVALAAIHSLARYRSERLLIECWDRLLTLENGEPARPEPD
jgi:hypothetical protein